MKITFILPGYPSAPTGGFRVIYQYANCLVDRGHEVSVVHPYRLNLNDMPQNISFPWLRQQWRKVLKWQGTRRPPKLEWQNFDRRVQLLYLKDVPSYDHIPAGDAVLATAWETAKYVSSYPESKGIKFHYVADYERWFAANSEQKRLMREAFALPLIKMAISQLSLNMARECDPISPIHKVPNALDHSLYRVYTPIERRKKYIIGMPYRTALYKGVADGLEAARIVKSYLPDLRLVLFGSLPLEHRLDSWMEYVQKPKDHEIVEIYNRVSLFVVPSWAEGWGLPGMEAMACGAALCSTDTGGVNEYAVHEQTALISPPRNPNRLAKNIIILLQNDALRYQLAKTGAEAIKKFTWTRSITILEDVIKAYCS